MVLGLLASVQSDADGLEPILDRSIKYFEKRQSPDGAFRYGGCADVRMTTCITLMALFACRDRDLESYRPEGPYVELFDPRVLSSFFQGPADPSRTWDRFLEEPHADLQAGPEDLFSAARKAFRAKDLAGALRLRADVLAGQGPDGSWAADGEDEGRKLIATAVRVRTLQLLQAVVADTLVRR